MSQFFPGVRFQFVRNVCVRALFSTWLYTVWGTIIWYSPARSSFGSSISCLKLKLYDNEVSCLCGNTDGRQESR